MITFDHLAAVKNMTFQLWEDKSSIFTVELSKYCDKVATLRPAFYDLNERHRFRFQPWAWLWFHS